MHPSRLSFAQFIIALMMISFASPSYAGWFGPSGGSSNWMQCLTAPDKEECMKKLNAQNEENKKKQEEAKNAPPLKEYGFKIGTVEFKDVPEGISGFQVFCVVYGTDQAPTDGTAAHAEMKESTGYMSKTSQTVYSSGITKNFGGYFVDNPVRRLKSSAQVGEIIASYTGNTSLTAKTWGCGLMLTENYSKNKQTEQSYYDTTNPGGNTAPIGGTSKVWVTGKMPMTFNPSSGQSIDLNGGQQNGIEVPKGQKFPKY